MGKRNKNKKIDIELVNKLFEYKNGNLFWRKTLNNRSIKGNIAGSFNTNRYRVVAYNGNLNLVHRIIYTMFYGDIPDGYQIDHKDENKSNNNIDNLRLATQGQNKMNRGKFKNNTSGYKGVSVARKRWKAQIYFNGKLKHLGNFDTPELAYETYIKFSKEIQGEFAHG